MDKRIIKTKNKLKENLLSLLETKRLQDITVLELCKEAKLNRTTFYKYYKSVEDLAQSIENELITELKTTIPNIKRNYLISFTNNIIEAISKNKEVCIKLLGENGDQFFLRNTLSIVYNESISEWQKLLKKASKEDLDGIYSFIVDGTIGIVNNWIKNGCEKDPSNITIFINKIY